MTKLKLCFFLWIISFSCYAQEIEYDRTIKPFFIATFTPKENTLDKTARVQIQQQHMQYIQSLAKDQKLVLAGPYASGGGLFFLNTNDESQAKTWIEADPTIKNHLNSYTLKKWFTEKGLFTLDNEIKPKKDYGQLNPNAPKETIQYGQLVGEWNVNISNLTDAGTWTEEKAHWKFTYILNGYAIQDFWTKKASENSTITLDYLGTNIRIYHPETKLWKCTWIENEHNDMNGVWTSYMNKQNEIILHDETKSWEIKFFNITETSFDWKWEYKLDDGSMETRIKIKANRK